VEPAKSPIRSSAVGHDDSGRVAPNPFKNSRLLWSSLSINSIGFDQFERRHAAPRLQRGCVRFLPDEVRRVLGDIGADEFVFSDAITKVEMPHITQGRRARIGDATHCPLFLSGMAATPKGRIASDILTTIPQSHPAMEKIGP
jgi:hypothetical protein